MNSSFFKWRNQQICIYGVQKETETTANGEELDDLEGLSMNEEKEEIFLLQTNRIIVIDFKYNFIERT